MLLSVALVTSIGAISHGRDAAPIAIEEFQLSNGLHVILHRDKSKPVVAVNVWYHVGSKDDPPGRSGLAHLFEHMMLQGSKSCDVDYFEVLKQAGGISNAATNRDRTSYFEIVPSNFLELALFMEADRMGGLLDVLRPDKIDNQREVVQNERRQRLDRPLGWSTEKIFEFIFPETSPYHHSMIGSASDLESSSMDDIRTFYQKYYVPNNASLVIAGDFEPQQTRRWIEKYFGRIPKGPDAKSLKVEASPLKGEIRRTIEAGIPQSQLYMVWRTPSMFSDDAWALTMLARVLANGGDSRLQSNVVFRERIAENVSAQNTFMEAGGLFIIRATLKSGVSIRDLEDAINREIERIKLEPPSNDEIISASNSEESELLAQMQSTSARADRLNQYVAYGRSATNFRDDLLRHRNVTAIDIQRVARAYLGGGRLVLDITPRKPGSNVSQSESEPSVKETPTSTTHVALISQCKLPEPGPDPKLNLPPVNRFTLSNGLKVMAIQSPLSGMVSMNLVLNVGSVNDPSDFPGLASTTAQLLTSGTSRTALEIAKGLQKIGVGFRINSDRESTRISMQVLEQNFSSALDYYSDLIVNPTFPANEVETLQDRRLAGSRGLNSSAVAESALKNLLFSGEGSYGRKIDGDEQSGRTISRQQIEDFHSKYYRPNNGTLIIVGDFDLQRVKVDVDKAFSPWKRQSIPRATAPRPSGSRKMSVRIIDKPGAAQSLILAGQISVGRNSPDYFPILVLNEIFGADVTSRLSKNLREDKGISYGAFSRLELGRSSGYLVTSAPVETTATKQAIVELLSEFRGIRGPIPISTEELNASKQALIQQFLLSFETTGQVSDQFASLVSYKLRDDYFSKYQQKIRNVSLRDVERVAEKYIDDNKMIFIIVGDRKVIEPQIREINGFGRNIRFLDINGNSIN